MTDRDFDIWLHDFALGTREAPEEALCRVFGIPQAAAQALLASLPRIVKRDATLAQAERLVHALEAIGGRAEAVPTKITIAPVVVVGQPALAPSATLVRHAHPVARLPPLTASSPAGSAATVRLGTQELAAYFAPLEQPAALLARPPSPGVYAADPHDTLVEPTPSWAEPEPEPPPQPVTRWADLELSTPDELPSPEPIEITRNAHDWLESVAHLPPLSLEPPATKRISSNAPGLPAGGWQSPLELPAFDAPPPHGLTMRTAAERARPRSMHPARANAAGARTATPELSDGLMQLARGELRSVARSHPSLAFLVVLIGTTLAFMVAYAAL